MFLFKILLSKEMVLHIWLNFSLYFQTVWPWSIVGTLFEDKVFQNVLMLVCLYCIYDERYFVSVTIIIQDICIFLRSMRFAVGGRGVRHNVS